MRHYFFSFSSLLPYLKILVVRLIPTLPRQRIETCLNNVNVYKNRPCCISLASCALIQTI